mgnify:CR=1 FL=1
MDKKITEFDLLIETHKLKYTNVCLLWKKYIDIKQSMMNGGGPACLRFKIVVNENEFNNINPNFLLTPVLIKKLESLIKNSYRDTLEIRDLADPELINESYSEGYNFPKNEVRLAEEASTILD